MNRAGSVMNHYERKHEPLIGRKQFLRRMKVHLSYSGLVVLASLVIGTAGFDVLARMPLIDAFLNASMLLGGMGPVGTISGNAGKIFASLFALYSGLVFLIVASFLFAPVFHRVLHRFHLEVQERK